MADLVQVSDPAAINRSSQRDRCNFCPNVKFDQFDPQLHESGDVFCDRIAFHDRSFKVWRCPNCNSLHCLDVVDLDHYYSKYGNRSLKLTFLLKLMYRNLSSRLFQHGMKKQHNFLDYGCNQGTFVKYLRSLGYTNVFGYDPYGADEFRDKSILGTEPSFDYIMVNNVIEHIEDPLALLRELDSVLKPGGYILIASPDADNIELNDISKHELHMPYHLHIPNRAVMEGLGQQVGWKTVTYFDRNYMDTPWPAANLRTVTRYVNLKSKEKCYDCVFQPLDLAVLLTSPSLWFLALFGYWLPLKTHFYMTAMLHKEPVQGDENS